MNSNGRLKAAIKQKLKAYIVRSALPVRFVQEVRHEGHLAFVRLRGWLDPLCRRRAKRLLEMEDVFLNFGCGQRILPGWINVDGWYRPGVDYVADLRRPLPLRPGSCQLIFTEHVIEHIDPQSVPSVLRELYRLLKAGGTLRIVVPDCRQFAEACARRDDAWFRQAAPYQDTMTEGLNDIFYNYFHRFLYDFHELERVLRQAGFVNIQQLSHRESRIPELRIDLDEPTRIVSNLYAEAQK